MANSVLTHAGETLNEHRNFLGNTKHPACPQEHTTVLWARAFKITSKQCKKAKTVALPRPQKKHLFTRWTETGRGAGKQRVALCLFSWDMCDRDSAFSLLCAHLGMTSETPSVGGYM